MTDYLLGALEDSENERLDELSVTDDEFADQLKAVENDLVDAYVRGELSEKVVDRFRLHYLASPKRREKVHFAQAFHNSIDNSPSFGREAVSEKAAVFAGTVPRNLFQWGFAAAALVLLLAGSYLILENVRLRNQIAQTQLEQTLLKKQEQELQRQLKRHSPDNETNSELTRVQQRLAELEKQLAARATQPDDRDVKLLALNLAPQTRGAGRIPRLKIPADIEAVVLTLELESNDFSAYQLELKDPATGKALWSNSSIKVENDSSSIPARVPASLLNSQNYLLEVSGISSRGVPEIVGSYPFTVVRK